MAAKMDACWAGLTAAPMEASTAVHWAARSAVHWAASMGMTMVDDLMEWHVSIGMLYIHTV